MRSKRVLTLLLVVCMLFSCFAPAAAVQAGSESSAAEVLTQNKDNTDSSASATGLTTLRETTDHVVSSAVQNNNIISGADISTGSNTSSASGSWSASVSNSGISVDLTNTSVPSFVEELREVSQNYAAGEKVTAFVILEQAPLVESYSSIIKVPQTAVAVLELVQKQFIQIMQKLVPVEVIDRFTYLTNAIVVETAIENLEKIALLDGVKSVFISPVFYACETEMSPYTVSSGQMTGVDSVWNTEELGYTGEGMTIAILDTGLDMDHPSFEADPEGALWDVDDIADLLEKYDLNAEQLYNGTLTADKLYYNAKVPFAFNYASASLNASHDSINGDHGSHVAGIAAANEVEGTGVVGMAPDAQIVVMKVFNSSTGGASMYDILNALEDCMTLGVDVANLSLGAAAGFSSSGAEEIDQIFENIANTDLVVEIAAGNEGTSAYGSLWGNYMNTTENVDTATVSSPSTYVNAISVASVDNNYVSSSYFTLADGTNVFYQPSAEYLQEYTTISLTDLADEELEYVIVPNLGNEADFYDSDENSIVDGKVAVVSRGSISFAEKIANAETAGAVAVLIWDNVAEDIYSFGMATEGEDGSYPTVPAVLISLADGQKMADAEDKTMTVSAEDGLRIDSNGGQVSSFSSWGVAPNLSLVPDIAGVGGNVYSCYDGGTYGLMSGTSMATPQVAGVTALVLQYIEENGLEAKLGVERRVLAESLMMSTAIPVIDADTDLEASPRQQGSGLVNALGAVTAEAYLTVGGSDCPKAELGDSKAGTYKFTFTVTNFSDEEKTYDLSASLLCEDYAIDSDYPGVYFMAEEEHALDESAVSFSADSVTVAAGGSATITVTINLTDDDMEWIDTYFPNGNYVEGFVYLTDAEGVDLSLPFLGFYGEWSDAPIFDTGFWYEDGFWADMFDGMEVDEVQANQFYTIPWISLGTSSTDWILGFNPYSGAVVDEEGHIVYNTKNNVLSPNGDGAVDSISEYYISMMRNAQDLYLTWTTADGQELLDSELLDYISKTMYTSGYGSTIPFVYSWYYDSLYDFAGLEDGAELTLTVSGVVEGEDSVSDSFTIPVTIDLTAPTLVSDSIVASTVEDRNYLTLTVEDAHLAYVALMNPTGTQVYNTYDDLAFTDNGDGTYTVTVDVTGLGDQFKVALCDYGCNEGYYNLTWTGEADNNPEMDEDALYAYQVYNEYIYYYYGYDYMFGWSTIDKETADVTMLQSDAYEYYALTAAEYAGGYIFAVDAGHNFLYMVPGVWNRMEICNIGLNVVDMAFDETTGTMYLATKDSDNYSYCLYTIDLLTGETTLLRDYYGQYYMPWAMTFVDGELYCCKYYYNGLYKVDIAGGTYNLTQVTLGDGSNLQFKTSANSSVSPYYSQSMTYSEADGKIYWAYYSYNGYDLIVIDPETLEYSATSFAWDQEYAGLLTLEGDYVLPESAEVTKLVISDESVILSTGGKHELGVTLLPWNAPVTKDLIWASDDTSVATVDADGVVTAVGEGSTVVTVSYGDVTASCTVNVVNISGNMYAYKYWDGNYDSGYWLDIDLETVTEEADVESPVDFIAADYNGHTGLIYGYDENGQCYWFNPETGDYGKLGTGSASLVPADMAYDYTTGLMYAIVNDQPTWSTALYVLNMTNGALLEVTTINYYYFVTLACSANNGAIYAIDYYGMLYELVLMEDDGTGGGGIGGWDPLRKKPEITIQSVGDGVTSYMVYPYELVQTPVIETYFVQSMCFDHNNNVLLWVNPENSTIYWIDDLDYDPFIVPLGDPSGTGLVEYTGTYVIPTDIPELDDEYITMVEAEDMMVLVGASKAPAVTIYPANATVQTVDSWESSDESVAYVDESGMVVGVSTGSAVITATVVDFDGWEFEASFTVTVKKGTDNIYGYLMTDISNYDGYYWMEIPDEDPTNYQGVSYVYYQDAYLTVYSAEYVDGTIYAYGYDDSDWNANFLFLTIDARTWSVTNAIDMGDGFPFVYDMAFDYTTGIMYALAGASDNITDLYYVNPENGELIFCTATGEDYMFLGLAIDAEGTIYAMAESVAEFDWDTWTTTLGNAQMYTIDPATDTIEWFMDAGATSNMLTTMAYDHDTGYIYWNALDETYASGFYLIDPKEHASYQLGTVGGGGAQVTGLMILADNYPELPDNLTNAVMVSALEELAVGGTVALDVFVQPFGLETEMTWTSSDESIATVDENGVVTGVSAGTVTITVTVSDGETTITDTCTIIVYGEDDFFLTYNATDAGFASIGRPDSTVVTNLTEGETEASVTAMAMVNGYIYAYDEENNLFLTSLEDDFARRYIGSAGIEVDEPYEEHTSYSNGTYGYDHYYTPGFEIRDMTWDETNGRLLALGCDVRYYETYYWYESASYSTRYLYGSGVEEKTKGCKIYEVDTTTGALTELCVVGGDNYESGVTMLTMTDSGEAYIYSYYMDYVMKLDLTDGTVKNLTTLQSLGVNGSYYGDLMAMTYDDVTNSLYMLLTESGKYYSLYQFDLLTQSFSLVGDVGEVVYANWSYTGDSFAGLVLNEEHFCTEADYVFAERIDATCTEDGYDVYACPLCGDSYNVVIPATGHTYGFGESSALVCIDCGHTYDSGIVTPSNPPIPGGSDESETPNDPDESEKPSDESSISHLTDVGDEWYYNYVDYVVTNGLMTGVTATTFDPNGTMTRAMVWTVLARMDGEDVDTTVSPWYAEAQEWAVENKISDGTLADGSITREQLVTMLYRYLGEPEVSASDKALLTGYADGTKVSDWAADAMTWAISNGIINGVTETSLDPQGVATRAQVAAILMRYCELAD